MTSLIYVLMTLVAPLSSALPVEERTSSDAVMTTTTGFRMSARELERLGITQEDALKHIQLLLQGNYACKATSASGSNGVRRAENDEMLRYHIRNRTVTCNDGSRPGFYIRKSQHGSTRWLIFLEGGWFCFDSRSCQGRWVNSPHLMSSNYWPVTRKGYGILSWNQEENPFIYNGNLVYVPYCSSDSWSGTSRSKQKGDFSFMGALILDEVIKELFHLHGLTTATKVYLAGSSAGGTGVLLNLDRVARMVSFLAPGVETRGIADSGWFLDNKQFREVPCTDSHSCAPAESVRRGVQLWQGMVPESCRHRFPDEQWKCYFGQNLYSSLQTVVFVIQYQFDEAQLTADNVGPPITKRQWEYIHSIGQDLKRTLANVTALFAPACLSHTMLTRSEWKRSVIDGVSLPDALSCWESGKFETNRYASSSSYQSSKRRGPYVGGGGGKAITAAALRGNNYRRTADRILADDPFKLAPKDTIYRKRLRSNKLPGKKRKKPSKKERRNQRRRAGNQSSVAMATPPKITVNRSSRQKRSSSSGGVFFDPHDMHHIRHHGNQCSHRRLDDCAWPQCNASCPRMRNPFTGEDMNYVDLLMQFGLDLSAVAGTIGVDLTTLENMDHGQLLHILIQSSR